MTRIIEDETAKREFAAKVEKMIGDQRPLYCYQCAKCTSGCPVAKIQPDYRPHQIVHLARLGLVDALFASPDLIWSCAGCVKCKEICPQDVAPADLILALKNIYLKMNLPVPKKFHEGMLTAIARYSRYQLPKMIRSRSRKYYDRKPLALPPLSTPADMKKFAATIRRIFEGDEG